MTKNKKQTSQTVASLASEVLTNKNSSEIGKKLAASALSQKNPSKQTGGKMEEIAAKVLQSEKYSETTKTLAASILTQSNKKR